MLVRFFETAFTATERISAGGTLKFRPVGDWTLAGFPDEHVNARPFTVKVGKNGRLDQELAFTDVTRAWEVTYLGNPGWGPVYVQILGEAAQAIDWPALVRIDPLTLHRAADPEAAWWAALEAAQLGVQAMPDPDDPDVLILTMQSWQLDPADPLAIILPIGA